ncbi:MAG: cysteine synthase A [Candidatus Omnitrophota bacterium]|jgi:cysteine synthase A
MTIHEDNSLSIGNTPMIKIKQMSKDCKANIYAKIEGRNPGYSVKCRIGANASTMM